MLYTEFVLLPWKFFLHPGIVFIIFILLLPRKFFLQPEFFLLFLLLPAQKFFFKYYFTTPEIFSQPWNFF